MNTNGVGVSNRDDFQWDQEQKTYHCPAGHKLNYQGKQLKQRSGGRTLPQLRFHCPPEHCQTCQLSSGCTPKPERGRTMTRMEGQELLDAQKEKMALPENKALYRLRPQTAERPFADAKWNRDFQRFHGRGSGRTHAETGLMVLAMNILALERLSKSLKNKDL